PARLSMPTVATRVPPVASIGSRISASRSSRRPVRRSKYGTGCRVCSSRCSPTTLTFAAGISASTPGSMPRPARRIGTSVILAPAMRRTATSPAQPGIVAASVSRSAVASYASSVPSSVTSSRKALVLSEASRSRPILCWTSGWRTSTVFMGQARNWMPEVCINRDGATKGAGRHAPARGGRAARRSERPAHHQLVARARILGLELVLVVIAIELVADGVELVEDLVLGGIEQVRGRQPHRHAVAEPLLDEGFQVRAVADGDLLADDE